VRAFYYHTELHDRLRYRIIVIGYENYFFCYIVEACEISEGRFSDRSEPKKFSKEVRRRVKVSRDIDPIEISYKVSTDEVPLEFKVYGLFRVKANSLDDMIQINGMISSLVGAIHENIADMVFNPPKNRPDAKLGISNTITDVKFPNPSQEDEEEDKDEEDDDEEEDEEDDEEEEEDEENNEDDGKYEGQIHGTAKRFSFLPQYQDSSYWEWVKATSREKIEIFFDEVPWDLAVVWQDHKHILNELWYRFNPYLRACMAESGKEVFVKMRKEFSGGGMKASTTLPVMRTTSHRNVEREVEILKQLEPLNLSPKFIELIHFEDLKTSALVLEDTGMSVKEWCSNNLQRNDFRDNNTNCTLTYGMIVKVVEVVGKFHECGWYHRDIKPSNMTVDVDGKVWLIDVELACPMDSREEILCQVVGTDHYMAPEISNKTSPFSIQSDLHSLGQTIRNIIEKYCNDIPWFYKDERSVFSDVFSMARRMSSIEVEDRPSIQEVLNFLSNFDPLEDKKKENGGETQKTASETFVSDENVDPNLV